MRHTIGLLALLALGCSGNQGGQSAAQPEGENGAPAPPVATPPVPRAPATIYEVRMEMVRGKYLFNPSSLTIKPGDGVRWINVNGGPHNVQFKKNRIPPGAQPILDASMANRIQELTGQFLKDSLASYVVSFTSAPAGTYAYVCQPHEILGMTGTITVSP